MKNKILNTLIRWLERLKTSEVNSKAAREPYNSLSPIDNADIENGYKEALDWALNNREELDIKNIALTGPYGSGKSSILKTYIAKYRSSDLYFLNISLATFKEEEEKSESENTDLLRLIELSILQQIFYHEDDKKIPDSRFRKIRTYTKWDLTVTALAIFILVNCTLFLVFPNLPKSFLHVDLNKQIIDFGKYASLIVLCLGVFIIIYRSIRIFNGLKINKLNIQNAEIEIDRANKSILNHHIDEILYFFEVTKYNVVIIEDLDRFKETEIFTKLREINLLINSSEKIKKRVVFIYAVRDEMFKGQNERTKFFDFIIPVIPVINPSNSSQKFLEKATTYSYNISENLLDSISIFIDDMRLLHNIANEFYLYKKKLNEKLNHDKLLSIIVYKNLYPLDFTLLSNNEGILFKAINNKQQYIKLKKSEIEDKINSYKSEIKALEELQIKNVLELRFLYIFYYLNEIPDLTKFSTSYQNISPVEMAQEEYFEVLRNDKAEYITYNNSYARRISLKFSDVEKKIDKNKRYLQRATDIKDWTENKTNFYRQEIRKLEILKLELPTQLISNLIKQDQFDIESSDSKQKNLVYLLLRNGFIDEDYLDYVSLFYEGSITKRDYQFIINLKSHINTPFDFKLDKIDKLIGKINQMEFKNEYALNYSLLDFVLVNHGFDNVRDNIFFKLQDESESSFAFIDGFIEITPNIENFVRILISKWINVWSFVEEKSNLTEERKKLYFKLIIQNAHLHDIKRLYSSSLFKNYLLAHEEFLNVTTDFDEIEIIIKELDIKFSKLNLKDSPKELITFIYDGNYYTINIHMVKSLLVSRGYLTDIDFDTKNYYAISQSECEKLKQYIDENINEYIEEIYLKLENNNKEEGGAYIKLLNNSELNFENKSLLITKITTLVLDVSKIDEVRIIDCLFEESKVLASWDNIFYYYRNNEEKLPTSIINFLNKDAHAMDLSKIKIKKDEKDKTEYSDFINSLLNANELKDSNYGLILNSIPYVYSSFDATILTKAKARFLIEKRILNLSNENFAMLRKEHADLHITFLEANRNKFLSSILDFNLNEDDILKILSSQLFTNEEKNKITDTIPEDLITVNSKSLKVIGELILKNGAFRVTDTLAKLAVVNNLLTIEQRIRIQNWKQNQIEASYYDTFLNCLGDPYSDITIKGKRPLLKNNEYNLKLVSVLAEKKCISSYNSDDKGIRVNTFKTDNQED